MSHGPCLQATFLTFFCLSPQTSKLRGKEPTSQQYRNTSWKSSQASQPRNLSWRQSLSWINFPFSMTVALKCSPQVSSDAWETDGKHNSGIHPRPPDLESMSSTAAEFNGGICRAWEFESHCSNLLVLNPIVVINTITWSTLKTVDAWGPSRQPDAINPYWGLSLSASKEPSRWFCCVACPGETH